MIKNIRYVLWFVVVILLILFISGTVSAKTNHGIKLLGLSKSALIPVLSAGNQTSNTGQGITSSSQGISKELVSDSIISGLKGASKKGVLSSLTFPIRAVFYYPWFPEAWTQQNIYPYTNYHPSLGYYDLSDLGIIRQQINAMLYGYIEAGIASWWGQGTPTDTRLTALLSAAVGTPFKWSIYYETESLGNPSVSTLSADLTYLRDQYSNDPGFLRIDNRFVVFVYADANDGCDMVDRWHQANSVNAYIVLKVFPGYLSCPNQPDGWHQYAPANAADSQGQYSYTISPGFWKVGENPRLGRELMIWQQGVHDMVTSGANFQLITTFNEWGEGTAVESADEWATPSGFGAYLDALHNTLNYKYFLPTMQKLPAPIQ